MKVKFRREDLRKIIKGVQMFCDEIWVKNDGEWSMPSQFGGLSD